MRIKKKGLALWLALFLGVSSLSGCGGGDDGMTQLSEKGAEIVERSIAANYDQINRVITLHGRNLLCQLRRMSLISGCMRHIFYFIPAKQTLCLIPYPVRLPRSRSVIYNNLYSSHFSSQLYLFSLPKIFFIQILSGNAIVSILYNIWLPHTRAQPTKILVIATYLLLFSILYQFSCKKSK